MAVNHLKGKLVPQPAQAGKQLQKKKHRCKHAASGNVHPAGMQHLDRTVGPGRNSLGGTERPLPYRCHHFQVSQRTQLLQPRSDEETARRLGRSRIDTRQAEDSQAVGGERTPSVERYSKGSSCRSRATWFMSFRALEEAGPSCGLRVYQRSRSWLPPFHSAARRQPRGSRPASTPLSSMPNPAASPSQARSGWPFWVELYRILARRQTASLVDL